MLSIAQKFKNKDYTGGNRCIPCTAVNVGISSIVGGVLWTVSRETGVLAFLAAIVVIYFQGYIIPGTPKLTKKYLPTSILQLFGKNPIGSDVDSEDSKIDIEQKLIDAGIAQLVDSGADITLTDTFRKSWQAEIQETDEDIAVERLVEVFEFDTTNYHVQEYSEAFVLFAFNQQIALWPSQTALIADFSAAKVVPNWIEDWSELSQVQRGKVLSGLRVFLTECPTGDLVEIVSNTVESCCSEHEVLVGRCTETGERLFEQPLN